MHVANPSNDGASGCAEQNLDSCSVWRCRETCVISSANLCDAEQTVWVRSVYFALLN